MKWDHTQAELDEIRKQVMEQGQKIEKRQTHILPVFDMGPGHKLGYASTVLGTAEYDKEQERLDQGVI